MAKADLKTKATEANVEDFINSVADEQAREDCRKIAAMMEKITGEKPKMWGENVVGFGFRRLKYASGREVDWFDVGFSPRKVNLTLYLGLGEGWNENLLADLGKHKVGMGCLYVKKLSDINLEILEKMIDESVNQARKN